MLLAESGSPTEQPSASAANTGQNVCTQNYVAGRRLETEAASLLHRVGGKDLYNGFGHTVAGQCHNLPLDRCIEFMSFVIAVGDIYSTSTSPPGVKYLISSVHTAMSNTASSLSVEQTILAQIPQSHIVGTIVVWLIHVSKT